MAHAPSPLDPQDADDGENQDVDVSGEEVVTGEFVDPPQGDRRVVAGGFSGPLPPPSILGEYDDVMPGLSREIVDQWRTETAHRRATVDGMRSTDREAMLAYYAGEKRGQIFAFILGLAVVFLGVLAIVLDRPAVGIAGILLGAASVIWSMRRQSTLPGPSEPTDVGDGNAVEQVDGPDTSAGARQSRDS